MKLHHHRHDENKALQDLLLTTGAAQAKTIRKVVITGCVVNALLMIMKLTVGWFGHSDALVADGFHSLNDVAVDLIMLIFVGISYRGANDAYAYGYGKYETFCSFAISLLLLFISVMICVEGVKAIVDYSHGAVLESPDIWTVVAVVIAICTKEVLYRYYTKAGRQLESRALSGAGLHHRIDAMTSVATLIGVVCAHFFGEKMRVLDPGASVLIGVMILIPAFRLMLPSFRELMEHSLPASMERKAREVIEHVPGVAGIARLKTRGSGHSKIFDVTVFVDGHITVEQGSVIAGEIEKGLVNAFCPHIYVTVATQPAPAGTHIGN